MFYEPCLYLSSLLVTCSSSHLVYQIVTSEANGSDGDLTGQTGILNKSKQRKLEIRLLSVRTEPSEVTYRFWHLSIFLFFNKAESFVSIEVQKKLQQPV